MKDFIQRAFRGLLPSYYFRQLFFGAIVAVVMISADISLHKSIAEMIFFCIFIGASALLYPYSRFVYESIISFIMGDNIFITNVLLMLFVKFITMAFCFAFAVFIAPIGLLFLGFYHSRKTGFTTDN